MILLRAATNLMIAAFAISPCGAQPQPPEQPPPLRAASAVRLLERGAILADDFDAAHIDLTRWRVWQNQPELTAVKQQGGRLTIEARGRVGMNGLWGLTTTRRKDGSLVGKSDGKTETTSRAWFDNVRIYPRGPSHHVGIHLVRPNGGVIYTRPKGTWPPLIADSAGNVRKLTELTSLWAGCPHPAPFGPRPKPRALLNSRAEQQS